MNLHALASYGLTATGGLLLEASSGVSIQGIAAVISASAGLLASATALILGLRSRGSVSEHVREEILMELLKEQMEENQDARKRRRRQRPDGET